MKRMMYYDSCLYSKLTIHCVPNIPMRDKENGDMVPCVGDGILVPFPFVRYGTRIPYPLVANGILVPYPLVTCGTRIPYPWVAGGILVLYTKVEYGNRISYIWVADSILTVC